ncbi:hypothetical protein ACSFVZ_05985 [Pseudoalteromonas sp. SYSU M81236]|uniref:hypothetical protein n=1 Tax=Pseudoalteromonas sp. SYSU M81236 TaxID=3447014 RepID=UPI003F047404
MVINSEVNRFYREFGSLMVELENGTIWCFVDEPKINLSGKKVKIFKEGVDFVLTIEDQSSSYVVTEF